MDFEIRRLIEKEIKRQKETLNLIASENYVSREVLEAMGSVLTNKYSEGYPGKRYYAGNEFIDQVENLAQERAKELFRVPHVNVQPYSGSPANLAVYLATCRPGDVIMGLDLTNGGHLTHGWKASATALFYRSVQYHVTPEGKVDFEEVRRLAREHQPKLIWAGATAYVYEYDYAQFAEIADEVGAYFAADIAHVAGLIAAHVHSDPVPYAHILTTTTHKTLRGPRGAMIMVTERGLAKDPELADKIDRAVFPALQGGPHDHKTAAIAVALKEAAAPEFKTYAAQIVKNAKALASELKAQGLRLVGDGTENHLILVDLRSFGPGRGIFAEKALDRAGITVNKNTIPGEPSSPFYPSGIRLGTPALTSRGMKEEEMKKIGKWIAEIIKFACKTELPEEKTDRVEAVKNFTAALEKNELIRRIGKEVRSFASAFPLPGVDS